MILVHSVLLPLLFFFVKGIPWYFVLFDVLTASLFYLVVFPSMLQ